MWDGFIFASHTIRVGRSGLCGSIKEQMITLEPPRDGASDAEAWRSLGLSRSGLSRFVRTAQNAVGLDGEVEVLLANDRTLRRLNRQYRGKDKPTDVLSFPATANYAGDLAISLDTAQKQANEHGHSLRDEIRVLLLHGILHLSGMDHETDSGEMAAAEDSLRKKLGLPNSLIERVKQKAATSSSHSRRRKLVAA